MSCIQQVSVRPYRATSLGTLRARQEKLFLLHLAWHALPMTSATHFHYKLLLRRPVLEGIWTVNDPWFHSLDKLLLTMYPTAILTSDPFISHPYHSLLPFPYHRDDSTKTNATSAIAVQCQPTQQEHLGALKNQTTAVKNTVCAAAKTQMQKCIATYRPS